MEKKTADACKKIRALIVSWSQGASVDIDKLTRLSNKAYREAGSDAAHDAITSARAGIEGAIQAGRDVRADAARAESERLRVEIREMARNKPY